MRLRRVTLLAGFAVLVSIAVTSEGQAGGGTPITSCGQLVTTNAFLTQNLHCPGSDGVDVGAAKISIDLKGFRLRGDRSSGTRGIDTKGFGQVTIKNGTVRNFDIGISAQSGTDRVSISNLVVSGNAEDGVAIFGNSATIKSVTASGNASSGLSVLGDSAVVQSVTATGNALYGIGVLGDFVSVKSSTAAGNFVGFSVSGNGAKIQSSSASGNATVGIDVGGNAASIKGNTTDGNGFDGGASDLDGLGIRVLGYTVAPTGTNVAHGNDDTAECSPGSLC